MNYKFLATIATGCFIELVFSTPLGSQLSAQEPSASVANQEPATPAQEEDMPTTEKKKVPPTLAHSMKSIDGSDVDLSQYAGKVVVIVNTASKCGMTPQYKDLQKLHKDFSEQGVVVLGFPCNQFGGQEPAGESDIKKFCEKNYGVEFQLFSKVDVKGKEASPFFKELTEIDAKPAGAGAVKWNFEKFVLNKSGKLIARFGSSVKPSSKEFTAVIEDALKEVVPSPADEKESDKDRG